MSKPGFRQLPGYAKCSAGEARSQLYTAFDLGYISLVEAHELRCELKEISRMIRGLIRSLDRKESDSST